MSPYGAGDREGRPYEIIQMFLRKWKVCLTFCAVEGITMERKLSVEVRD